MVSFFKIIEIDNTFSNKSIVGGESGRKVREIKKEWVVEIREKCTKHNTPFFFKQWGGTNKKKAGCDLDGKVYKEMPLMQCA